MKLCLGLLILAAAGCAAPLPPAVNVKDGRGYCPVCDEWHPDAQLRRVVERDGRTYRFCDPNCAAAFGRDPDRFLGDRRFNPDP